MTIEHRRRVVAEIAAENQLNSAPAIAEMLPQRGVINERTGEPYSVSTVRNDMAAIRGVVSEIIGRETTPEKTLYVTSGLYSGLRKTVDETRADYAFWDKLRRGKLPGYRFGGLFCKPITEIIASYTLGDGIEVGLNIDEENERVEYTNALLQKLVDREHGTLLGVEVDRLALGDQWVFVNADGSLSIPSPDTVVAEYDPIDYRTLRAVTIRTRLEESDIEDRYTAEDRTVTVTWKAAVDGHQSGEKQQAVYKNLIGRIPAVHMPNDRAANETNGRPIYEGLLHLFSRYDDLLEKAVDGVELMGNPIPVFEGMENIRETVKANATSSPSEYIDRDGVTQERVEIRFDQQAALFVGKGGSFKFAAPPTGFSEDIRNVLKSLFLLMLDHTRIPEFLWGGAIASSKASAETQLPPFIQFIEMRRRQFEGSAGDSDLGMDSVGGLLEILDIWLLYRALVDPRVVVASTMVKRWPELTETNWEILLKWVAYLHGIGGLDTPTSVMLAGVVDDPVEAVKAATAESQKQQEQQDDFLARFKAAQAEAGSEQSDDLEAA